MWDTQFWLIGNGTPSMKTLATKAIDKNYTVGIIIVAWNSRDDLFASLSALARSPDQRYWTKCKIVIVDNGGNGDLYTDFSKQAIAGKFDQILVVNSGKNIGFAAACNLGAASASADYYVFMNADVAIEANDIRRLADMLEADKGISAVGPAFNDKEGKQWRSCSYSPTFLSLLFAGALGNLWGVFGKSGRFMTEWDHSNSRNVEQIIGALMCIRGESFRAISGFDERFFVYYEEVDLCIRLRKSQGAVKYVHEVSAFHAGGGASKSDFAKRCFYSCRSRFLFTEKYHGKFKAYAVATSTILLEGAGKSVYHLALGRMPEMRGRIVGTLGFCRWIVSYQFSSGRDKKLETSQEIRFL